MGQNTGRQNNAQESRNSQKQCEGKKTMNDLIVQSSVFENNSWMPDKCSGYGENKSPDLKIDGIPKETVTLAVIMDDLDHPVFCEFNHWTAWNIPCADTIPEGIPGGAVSEKPFHIEQGVGYGKHIYRGPKPPFNGKHRYRFRVYALDTRLQLPYDSRKKDLISAMDGHILAIGELTGIYQRNHQL